MVVRVVVTALESAPPDAADSSDSSRTQRSHILMPTPEGRAEGSVANELEGKRNSVYIWQKIGFWVTDCTQSPLREHRDPVHM